MGQSTSCCCQRLTRLRAQGLTCGPACNQRRRWNLTPAGRALAAASVPVIDDLDQRILGEIALSPLRQLALARRVGCCSLTAKRRLRWLTQRGMVEADDMRRYTITDQGRQALGDAMPKRPARWVRPEQISAALAFDVARRRAAFDDRSGWTRSQRPQTAYEANAA